MEQIAILDWLETRDIVKAKNNYMNDIIKEFTRYAKAQGSRNFNRYYTIFSQLANKSVKIENGNRSFANKQKLLYLNAIMGIIEEKISEGISQKNYYKDIYKECKSRVEEFTHFIPKKVIES